jgi:glycopeptide antibiotics resistance protein
VIGVITLAPFHFELPAHWRVITYGHWFDGIANVLLFLPLGFLYPLTRANRNAVSPLRVFLLGLVLSTAIETTQLFEHERFTSVIDAVTNAAGAGIGAILLRAITRRMEVNAKLIGRLSLEIPLIGLIYLLVPLLLTASLSALAMPERLLSLVPLGLVGARLLSSVQRNYFAPLDLFDSRAMAAVAGGWMLLGVFPVLPRYPVIGMCLALLVLLITWFEAARRASGDRPERRFETHALRSAAPYIALYFTIVIFLPLSAGVGPWHFTIGLTGSHNDFTEQQLRLLEPIAALTVLGYLLAEARGRAERPFRAIAVRVTTECACVAMAIEASRGFQRDAGASGVQLGLMVAAGFLGAGIYHHQREHVRWILAHRGDVPARTG